MVTCASLPFSELCGEAIQVANGPNSGPPNMVPDPPQHVQVFDGANRLWLLPLDECQTWFVSGLVNSPLRFFYAESLLGLHFELSLCNPQF